jgi:ABC-type branched-subunit amino acid transport system substrate-binding protein
VQISESKQVLGVGTKGLTMYIVTTLVTYKTKDNYNGFIVKVKEKYGDKH